MTNSVLRKLLLASLGFGLAIGLIFPFFADLFVVWKPGMYVWFTFSALVAGALVGAVNYWLVNQILVSRLRRIAEAARAIGEGDLTHQCAIVSNDTVGEIIGAFNRMAATLRGLIGDLATMSGRLQSDTQAIEQLVAGIREQLARQHEDSREIASVMDALAQKGGEVAATARQVATSSEQALAVAESGTRVVAETVAGMAGIERTVARAADDVNQLGERSDQIGAIVAVIRGIAEQTNLLALNAAIEAARAGEQGRGFAVVADEVRKLAEKTGTATEEIGQMIGGIQTQVRQTVVSMEESRDQVKAGVDRAERAGRSLSEILASVQGVSAMMARITALAEDQRALAATIVGRVDSIASGSDDTLRRITACDDSCTALADQSAQLHEQARRFRIA